LSKDERDAGAGVLNGIAYDPARDVLLITGKRWPAMFEVDLVR
jgi:glutamine cyclotransferase